MAGIATVAVCKETLSHVGSDKLYAMRVRFFICEQSALLWKGYHCWEVPPGHCFPWDCDFPRLLDRRFVKWQICYCTSRSLHHKVHCISLWGGSFSWLRCSYGRGGRVFAGSRMFSRSIYATRLGHQQRHVLVNFLLYSIIGVLKLVGYFMVKPYQSPWVQLPASFCPNPDSSIKVLSVHPLVLNIVNWTHRRLGSSLANPGPFRSRTRHKPGMKVIRCNPVSSPMECTNYTTCNS